MSDYTEKMVRKQAEKDFLIRQQFAMDQTEKDLEARELALLDQEAKDQQYLQDESERRRAARHRALLDSEEKDREALEAVLDDQEREHDRIRQQWAEEQAEKEASGELYVESPLGGMTMEPPGELRVDKVGELKVAGAEKKRDVTKLSDHDRRGLVMRERQAEDKEKEIRRLRRENKRALNHKTEVPPVRTREAMLGKCEEVLTD
jgi:hypothetical protein